MTRARMLLVALIAGAIVVPVAAAKMRISLGMSDGTPHVGQTIALTLVAERALSEFELRYGFHLVAVAPRASCHARLRFGSIDTLNRCERTHMYAVISKAVSNKPLARADGWSIPLTQASDTTWTGTVTFPRRGRWLLVVPNGPTVGYSIPPPVVRAVVVRSS